jgi:hypothetical protein
VATSTTKLRPAAATRCGCSITTRSA